MYLLKLHFGRFDYPWPTEIHPSPRSGTHKLRLEPTFAPGLKWILIRLT